MKTTLKLEELAMFLIGLYAFGFLYYEWWWFLLLFFLPDAGMLGYLVNSKIGAIFYNLLHHKGLAILCYLFGFFFTAPVFQLIGCVIFTHASFDRILGYGLKYEYGFRFTHLGVLQDNQVLSKNKKS